MNRVALLTWATAILLTWSSLAHAEESVSAEGAAIPEAQPEDVAARGTDAATGGATGGTEEREFRSRLTFGDPRRAQIAIPGEYALRIVGQSDLIVSAVPTDRENPDENIFYDPEHPEDNNNALGQNFYLLHWLRVRPTLTFLRRFRLVGQMDVLHGHIAGDDTHHVEARTERTNQEGVSADGIRPRHLYLEWNTDFGVLRVGQMGSHWGMGILNNDGDHSEEYLFGDHQFGDIVERVIFSVTPFQRLQNAELRKLAFFLGGDLVFDDGTANLVEGDLAFQLITGMLWRGDAERAVGLYVAYRNQTYADGDELDVVALDAYGEWSFQLAHQVRAYIEGEVAGVFGTTNAAPNLYFEETNLRQLGLAARLGLRLDSINLDIRLEGGFSSGDADVNDNRTGRFAIDPDFRVGLILFPELLSWSTARAAAIAGHEELVGQPQDGTELFSTNGSVAGAAYFYPSIRWDPLDWLSVRFAMLLAQATSDVISPFETKRQGQRASFRGGPASSRDLGFEIDLGVEARLNLEYFQLRGGVEGAYCIPGRAFDTLDGDRHDEIGLVRGRLQVDW